MKIFTQKLTLITLVCLLFLSPSGFSAPPTAIILEQKIDSLVGISLQEDQPGGVIGITTPGKDIFQKAYGLANLATKTPNTRQTAINLASVTKHFTAFAILLLEEEGKLSLNDQVHKFIPELPDYGHNITIGHLLHHTAGIAPTDNLRLFAGRSLELPWDHNDELEMICNYPILNATPGDEYLYSNGGYSLLATIIERTSGMSYPDYLQKSIFGPLGMTNTHVNDQVGKVIPNMATGYEKQTEGFRASEGTNDVSLGCSNIFSSASDLARWGKNFFNPRVGNKEMMQRIFNPSFVLNNGDTINYSFGMNVSIYKGLKLVSHSGGDLGYRTQLWIFPQQEMVFYAAFNTDGINTRNLMAAIVDNYMKDYLEIPQPPKERIATEVDPITLKPYEGTFLMPDGMNLSFVVERDTFWLVIPDAPHFQLFAETNTHFFLKAFNAQVTFVPGQDGQVNEMIWHQGGREYKSLRSSGSILPGIEELAAYAGKYYHQALEVEYPIEFVEGALILSPPETFQTLFNIGKVTLVPMGDDRFMAKDSPLGVIWFSRDANNQINGFKIVDVGRLKNIAFTKM